MTLETGISHLLVARKREQLDVREDIEERCCYKHFYTVSYKYVVRCEQPYNTSAMVIFSLYCYNFSTYNKTNFSSRDIYIVSFFFSSSSSFTPFFSRSCREYSVFVLFTPLAPPTPEKEWLSRRRLYCETRDVLDLICILFILRIKE